jgi:hypothetical protein
MPIKLIVRRWEDTEELIAWSIVRILNSGRSLSIAPTSVRISFSSWRNGSEERTTSENIHGACWEAG